MAMQGASTSAIMIFFMQVRAGNYIIEKIARFSFNLNEDKKHNISKVMLVSTSIFRQISAWETTFLGIYQELFFWL